MMAPPNTHLEPVENYDGDDDDDDKQRLKTKAEELMCGARKALN